MYLVFLQNNGEIFHCEFGKALCYQAIGEETSVLGQVGPSSSPAQSLIKYGLGEVNFAEGLFLRLHNRVLWGWRGRSMRRAERSACWDSSVVLKETVVCL